MKEKLYEKRTVISKIHNHRSIPSPPPKKKSSNGKARNQWHGAAVFIAFLVIAFSVSGCGDLGDSVGEDPPEPEYIPAREPVDGAATMPSVREKFGVTPEGKAGVTAAFLELSAY
jgi:hypothetical protein